MKDKGIGTAATRANIIEKSLLCGFVVREKSKLLSTENGRQLCRELATRAPNMLWAKLTGEWELILKMVRRGVCHAAGERAGGKTVARDGPEVGDGQP